MAAALQIDKRNFRAYILQTLGRVYHNDAITRERGMTPEARLTFHQTRAAR